MKIEELRIGNYLNQLLGYVKNEAQYQMVEVSAYLFGTYFQTNFDEFVPIPLTEEWLIKLGFRKMYVYDDVYLKNTFSSPFSLDSEDFLFDNRVKMLMVDVEDIIQHKGVKIEFVHQLQNLYFSLTGEELTIK